MWVRQQPGRGIAVSGIANGETTSIASGEDNEYCCCAVRRTPESRHLRTPEFPSAPGLRCPMTQTNRSILVMAPVLTVCRYLSDITNIARGLPGVCSVVAGPAQMITISYRAAAGRRARLAPGRFRIDRQRQRIEWEIRGSIRYRGALSVFGDCNVSRVQSELSSDQPSLSDAARDLHTEMLQRIAQAVQAGDQMPPSAPHRTSNVVEPTDLGQFDALGGEGMVRESWAAGVRS